MNRPTADAPERLLSADATDFERRLLEAAGQRKPSSAASARMAKALGVTVAGATAAAATTLGADVAVAKTAVAGASAVSPWISVSVLGLVVAGAVVGTRAYHSRPKQVRPAPAVSAPATPAARTAEPMQPEQPAPAVVEPAPSPAASRRTRVSMAAELRDQIAFIDNARSELASGADRRALETLRRYQDRYPTGSFRPEATALRVEALVKLGRQDEARVLAERFVAEHRGSLLAKRVAELAGLERP